MQARDRVLATDQHGPDSIAPDRIERRPAILRRRPLHRIGRGQRGIDDEPLRAAQSPLQRIAVVERVHVPRRGSLRLRLEQHVGVAGVEALDRGALVTHRVGRDQVVAVTEHEDVAIEGRAVLLPDDQHPVRLGERMRPAAGDPELVVQDAVVLVGDLLVDDVLVFRGGHHHQVGEAVAQVAGVVHVDVGRAGQPAFVGDVGDLGEPDRCRVDLPLLDQRLEGEGLRLEAAHNGDLGRPDREFHAERTRVMEDPVAGAAHAGVGVGGRVDLAVGGGEVDAAGDGVVVGVDRGQRQRARRPRPVPLGDVDPAERPAVGFQQMELRQSAVVRHERDPLRIG